LRAAFVLQLVAMKPRSRKFCLWLFATLLPLALWAAPQKHSTQQPRQLIFPVAKGKDQSKQLFGWKDNSHLWLLAFPQEKLWPGTFTQREWNIQTGRLRFITRFKEPSNTGGSTGKIELFSPKTQLATYSISDTEFFLVNLRTHEWTELEFERPIRLRDRELVGCTDNALRNNKPDALSVAFTNLTSLKLIRTVGVNPPAGRAFSYCIGEKNYFPPLIDVSENNNIGVVATALSGASGWDGLLIFNARSGKTLHHFIPKDQSVLGLLCSPDGNTVSAYGSTVYFWNSRSGKRISQQVSPSSEYWWKMAFSPNSKRFAALHGKTGFIWDVRTGQRLQTIYMQPSPNTYESLTLSFSPDSRTLAAFDQWRTLTLWRVN
jgi:WD40 repeat protein